MIVTAEAGDSAAATASSVTGRKLEAGDKVCSADGNELKGSTGWLLKKGEEAEVVCVFSDGDVVLRNPHGAKSGCLPSSRFVLAVPGGGAAAASSTMVVAAVPGGQPRRTPAIGGRCSPPIDREQQLLELIKSLMWDRKVYTPEALTRALEVLNDQLLQELLRSYNSMTGFLRGHAEMFDELPRHEGTHVRFQLGFEFFSARALQQ
eukprot:gene16579-19573_t